jgi:hypothetical protein
MAQDVDALNDVLARRENSVLSKTFTFGCGRNRYWFQTTAPGTALRGARVGMLHCHDGTLQVRYKDRTLASTAFNAPHTPVKVESEASYKGRLDEINAQIAVTAPKTRPPVSRDCG